MLQIVFFYPHKILIFGFYLNDNILCETNHTERPNEIYVY